MRKLYVIGAPIGHSLSPVMHRAALEKLGESDPTLRDIRYEAREVAPDALAEFVHEVRSDDEVLGFNVTLPHKVAIAAMLDGLEESATRIQAVNTVVRSGAQWVGANTDAAGLLASLDERGVSLSGRSAVILGSGGAARAALFALAGRVGRLHVAARNAAAARVLAGSFGPEVGSGPLTSDALGELGADLYVQATSASLEPSAAAALAATVPLERAKPGCVVLDSVYRPRETALLARARSLGLTAVDGVGMLVHQGALSLARWTGVQPDTEVMRAAVLAHL